MFLENRKTFDIFLHQLQVSFHILVELIPSYLFYIYKKAFYLSTEEKVLESGYLKD